MLAKQLLGDSDACMESFECGTSPTKGDFRVPKAYAELCISLCSKPGVKYGVNNEAIISIPAIELAKLIRALVANSADEGRQ